MTKLEQLEREIANLSPQDLAAFREWFFAHDATLWDQQFEGDVRAGKLDRLRREAVEEHERRETREL